MKKKRKEDIAFQAEQDAKKGKWNPPHEGAFGLRSTMLYSSYSEAEKQDRQHYKRVYKHHK